MAVTWNIMLWTYDTHTSLFILTASLATRVNLKGDTEGAGCVPNIDKYTRFIGSWCQITKQVFTSIMIISQTSHTLSA